MEDIQLIQLLQLLLALGDRYHNEAEYYTYLISRKKTIPSDLFINYLTALIKAEEFDKIAADVYNVLDLF